MSKHLLLADDSITIQKVVELTFSDSGYRVTCVPAGGQALAKVREDRPDIILCDVIMPEKNGYEVTEALKSSPATRGIPIILLSGTFEPFDEERAKKAGADAWITKPFESQQLVALVEEHLQKRIVVGGDAPFSSTQVTGSGPHQGVVNQAPNPSETVNMAPPADRYSAYSNPPPIAASPFNTLPPPVSADPYAVPAFNLQPPAGHSVSAATTAAMPAVSGSDSSAPPRPAFPGLEERRQAVTQDMSQRSAEPVDAVPALADAGGPGIRSTAPWAPLPPTPEPAVFSAPAPAPTPAPAPEPEPDADFGAGTMQMMVGTGVKPWEQQPPEEAFAPPKIRAEQLLEETHRRGEAPALDAPPVRPSAGPPGYIPQAERPVSPTDSTETLPALNPLPDSVPSWMAPAPPPPSTQPAAEVPAWMSPAAAVSPAAAIAESVPAWMSSAEPAPVPASSAAIEEPPISAVPSWMSPAKAEAAAPLAVPSSSWMDTPETAVPPEPAAEPAWMTPAPAMSMTPAVAVESAPAPFLAPEIPEHAEVAPPPPPPPPPPLPPEAAFAPVPSWLAAAPPIPEPVAAPAPSWLTPGGTPDLPRSAELEAPPADAFTAPQVRPDQLFEETKRSGAASSGASQSVTPPAAEASSDAFNSAATLAVMSAALGGEMSHSAVAPSQLARVTDPPASFMAEPAPASSPEPELAPAAGAVHLNEAQIEAIARKMVEIFGDKILREVAWEVIPDMAEMLIKNRIIELEGEAAKENEKPVS